MQDNILFDNIYIGHSESDAAAFRKETFTAKYAIESAKEKLDSPKEAEKVEEKKSYFERAKEFVIQYQYKVFLLAQAFFRHLPKIQSYRIGVEPRWLRSDRHPESSTTCFTQNKLHMLPKMCSVYFLK